MCMFTIDWKVKFLHQHTGVIARQDSAEGPICFMHTPNNKYLSIYSFPFLEMQIAWYFCYFQSFFVMHTPNNDYISFVSSVRSSYSHPDLLVTLALFDISIWHIDCRYIDTFEKYRYRYRYRYGHIWKYRYRYRYR